MAGNYRINGQNPYYFAVFYWNLDPMPLPHKGFGRPDCSEQCFGDPVNAGTGNKFEYKEEYSGVGQNSLRLVWTYNSIGTPSYLRSNALIFGRKRTYSYSETVALVPSPAGHVAYVTFEDGNTATFTSSDTNEWISETGTAYALLSEYNGSTLTGWVFNDGDGTLRTFDASGKLLSVTNRSGLTQSVEYDAQNRLRFVTDSKNRSLVFEYNTSGLVNKVKQPDGGELIFTYSTSKDLLQVQYPDGSTIQYRYDESGLIDAKTPKGSLTGVIDESLQRYSSTTYDIKGKATGTSMGAGLDSYSAVYSLASNISYSQSTLVNLPEGSSRSVQFSVVNGEVKPTTATIGCDGCVASTTSYTYGISGNLDLLTKNGLVTDFDRDAIGRVVQEVEAHADTSGAMRMTQTNWHGTLSLPIERRTYDAVNALVSKSIWTYNARGQTLTSAQIDPNTNAVRTITSTYCEQADAAAGTCPLIGLATSMDGPLAGTVDTTIYTYYPSEGATCATAPTTCPHRKGDLWKVTNALGHITETLRYDGAGRVLSVKDPNGIVTDLEYHPRGWLTARKVRGANDAVETDDAITRIEYWPTGLVKKVTQPDGEYTAYEYDAAHRLTAISDNAGNRIEYMLDNAGNRVKEDTKDAGGTLKRTLSRLYNQLGQLATVADAQANATDFGYDANGNATSVTDALGRQTHNDYDPLNRLKRTLQDVGGIQAETKFEYDALDNLTKVTDPKGLDTTYSYNGLGDLLQLSSPDTGTTTYTYDSAGNRKTQTDARGVTTHYSYDALNRLTAIAYPDNSLDIAYGYDVAQPVCTAGETYAIGRLTRMDDGSGSTQYCYDRFGNLARKVQTTHGVSFVLRYAYTLGGRLKAITYPDGSTVDYVRDAQGNVAEVGVARAGNPRQVLLQQAAYHPFGPVAEWTYGNGRRMYRTLDQDYRPLSIEDAGPGGLSLGFGYDDVGNLTRQGTAQGATVPKVGFDYDALGRLVATRDGPTQVAIDGYAYDKTGNRTAHTTALGTQAYAYPPDSHRLASVAGQPRGYDAVGNTLASGSRQYVYSDANRMSQVKQGGVVAMNYAYNGKGEQVRRHVGATNTYTLYDEAGYWLGDYDNAGNALQQALWMDDLPVGLLANGNQLHYVQPDHLGTPRVVIEAARDVPVWAWDIKGEAFGSTVPDQDPDGDAIPFVFDMRFPGQRFDAASGLNYNYFRDYDADTGRYSQSDPIGLHGGMSTYSYVMGMPLYAHDFYGLMANCRIEAVQQTGWYASGQNRKTTLRNQPLYIPVCAPILPKFGAPGPEDFGPDPKEYMKARRMLPSGSPPIPIEFTWKCKDLYYHKYILEAQELMSMSRAYVCRDDCGNITSKDFIDSYNSSRWVSRGKQWEIVSGSEYIVNE